MGILKCVNSCSNRKTIVSVVILCCLLLGSAGGGHVSAAPGDRYFYVDFEGGNDLAAGTATATAWKHAPGDENATGNPASTALQPGDTVCFKGGVNYRGSIRIPAGGTEGNQVTFSGDSWPGLSGTKAIMDGSESLTGWTQCGSAGECGGNPNYSNIYYAYVPTGVTPDCFMINLHEMNTATGEDEFLWGSQEPDMPDPYFYDDNLNFYTVLQGNITLTTITDPVHLTQGDAGYYDGSYALIWTNPNVVSPRLISSFGPAQHMITFPTLHNQAIYGDRDQSYSIYNNINGIDQVGEYVFNETAEPDGTHKVFLWPRNPAGIENNITYSVRDFGIDINNNSHVKISGFSIRKLGGVGVRGCLAVGTITGYSELEGITVSDNKMTHNRYSFNSNTSSGYGGVFLSDCSNSLVSGNVTVENPKHMGMFITGCTDTKVTQNQIRKPGSTALCCFGCENLELTENTIAESRGSHANGITLYLACYNVLIAKNRVFDSASPVTFQDSGNLYFVNNIFDGANGENNVNDWGETSGGPTARGTILFANNVMVRNSRNASLNIGDIPENTYIVKNNILDGGAGADTIDRSHNLYTGLCWYQDPFYGWELAEGEFVNEDLSQIFVDAENLDFRLLPESPAVNAGEDVYSLLPTDRFPDYDFHTDIDGNMRPLDGGWDMGAFEYDNPASPDFTITARVEGTGGTVSPTTQAVNAGENATVTITPSSGYRTSTIMDNGVLKPVADSYVLENVTEDHNVVVTFAEVAAETNTLYFAEGYTGDNFEEYLCLGNPGKAQATARITYLFPDGAVSNQSVVIPAGSRSTVFVNDVVGPGREVSIKIESGDAIFAERPMYFNYRGAWTGGHDVVAANSTSNTWYFAEGYTGTGFDQYVCVLNPGDEKAVVSFNFQTGEENINREGLSVNPHSRATFKVNDLLGPGFSNSLKLTSTEPVVAERSMYFNYLGMSERNWTGGSAVMGTPGLSNEYYFAEGTTRTGFEEWLTLQNPGEQSVKITAVYQLGTGQGDPVEKSYTVEAGTRSTVYVPNETGMEKDVSVKLTSTSPFLAERPMYFNYHGTWTGGHCVIGSPVTSGTWFLAEGYTGDGFAQWLCLQNPGEEESIVEITYYTKDAGPLPPKEVKIPAHSRSTVSVNEHAGPGLELSTGIIVKQGPGIVVERPMYFDMHSWTGGHDVVGNAVDYR